MDGFINAKIEAQTIYEIYRACRLCGAGAGYKMPIIQNVVDLDGAEVELKQKIRDCVQIEVHQDDKMPPLICELCVDKVNDFYEFLEMCRQTNKRTRLRLGLPPQTMPRGAPDAGDCILGITEPVFINEDSNEPLMKTKKNVKINIQKSSKNKHKDVKVKISLPSRRETELERLLPKSMRNKQPSPPRLRGSKRSHDDDESLGSLLRSKRSAVSVPKSILKKNENDENTPLSLRSRREKESSSKKVQIVTKSVPKVKNQENKYKCSKCNNQYNNHWSYNSHLRIHANEKSSDQKRQRSRSKELECEDCKKSFSSKYSLESHMCYAKTGKCDVCNKRFSSSHALRRHKSSCSQKRRATAVSPEMLRQLKPVSIKVSRCDSLLQNPVNGHYNVSDVPFDYGLDSSCVYPYLSRLRIKSEPVYMVDINDEIKEAFDADKYIHWDSDNTTSDVDMDDENTEKKVDSLTAIALKSIFSPKFLGKVPKKRRKVKAEKAFDSILNASEFDADIRLGIDSIIDRLDDSVDVMNKSTDNDSLFGDDKPPIVTNNDFDALFGDSQSNDKSDDVNKVSNTNESSDSVNDDSVNNEMIDNDGVRSKDSIVNRESENIESLVSDNVSIKVSDNGENKETTNNDESKNNHINNEESENTTKSNELKEKNDVSNEETIIAEPAESNDKDVNNDTNERSLESNLTNQNCDENDVCNDNNIEKCKKSDSNKTNENETKHQNIEKECNDKNNDHKDSVLTNNDNETVNTHPSKDTNLKLDDTNVNNKIGDVFGSNKSIQEENGDSQEDSVDNKTLNRDDRTTETMNTTDKKVMDITEMTPTAIDKTRETPEVVSRISEIGARNDENCANGEADIGDKFSMEDLEDVSDSEMDDKKLMDEIDAQIGEEKKIS